MKTNSTFAAGLLLAAAAWFASPLLCACAAASQADYVVHEWGTFTSVQGAEGVQMEWNPFHVQDLPPFVYERSRPDRRTNNAFSLLLLISKGEIRGQQRLETPVIYFYSNHALEVDVEAEFPQGILTEWYPQAGSFGPLPMELASVGPINRSFIRWDKVHVLPSTNAAEVRGSLPQDLSNNHYYAARATSANLVRVPALGPSGNEEQEEEAFLFYRGVGQFQAPLQVALSAGDATLTVHNTGQETLQELLLVEIHQGQGWFISIGDLKPDQQRSTDVSPTDAGARFQSREQFQRAIGAHLASALVGAGLYDKEAAAMVETWRESWFGDEGLRVLYILPRRWTDATLPLTLNPAPRETIRVMVGRAEVLRTSTAWELLRQTVHYSDAQDDAGRARAIDAVRTLGLGRFAEPLSQLVLGKRPHPRFRETVQTLLRAATSPAADNLTATEEPILGPLFDCSTRPR